MRIVPATDAAISEAAELIRRGELVAFPTETVYGLGARVWDEAAIKRIFEAKGRPEGHPLIAHVLGEDDARSLAKEWPEVASRIAKAFWPGPITVIVPKIAKVPDRVTGGLDSIAIRSPAHDVARALIEKVRDPIVAPSANKHQALSPTIAAHVRLFDPNVFVLDGGACPRGIESTVIDVRCVPARILRPGPIGLDRLRDAGITAELVTVTVKDGPRPSPGMGERHYAPRARLILLEHDETRPPGAAVLDLPEDPEQAGRELYARLFELDEKGARAICVRMPPDTEAWRAVRDRLKRAAK
jgi:L-threonylcarbamoyladenylate synthase